METTARLLEVTALTARFSIRLGDIPRQASMMRKADRLALASTINSTVHQLISRYLDGQKVDIAESICAELDDFDQSAPVEIAGGFLVATRTGLNIFCHFNKLSRDGDGEDDDDPHGPNGGTGSFVHLELEFLDTVSFLLVKDAALGFLDHDVVINLVIPDDQLVMRVVDGQHRHPISPFACVDPAAGPVVATEIDGYVAPDEFDLFGCSGALASVAARALLEARGALSAEMITAVAAALPAAEGDACEPSAAKEGRSPVSAIDHSAEDIV